MFEFYFKDGERLICSVFANNQDEAYKKYVNTGLDSRSYNNVTAAEILITGDNK